jgi:hypothetical protein
MEGPRETTNMTHILKPTVDAFIKHGPIARQGAEVLPIEVSLPEGTAPLQDGMTLERQYICLMGVIADTPFTAHWAQINGHSAKNGCRNCFIELQTKDAGVKLGGTRYCGYRSPATFRYFDRAA